MGRVRVETPVGGKVDIGGGVRIPARAKLSLSEYPDAPYGLEAWVVYENGRYVIEKLVICRQPGGPPVTSEGIRGVPIQGIVREMIRESSERIINTGTGKRVAARWARSDADIARLRAAGPVDETLQIVADVYRVSQAIGDPPAKSVAQGLQIPQRTATYWVKLARERGFLAPGPGRMRQRQQRQRQKGARG